MAALGVKHGFGFSARLIDYLINFRIATGPVLIIAFGCSTSSSITSSSIS